MTNGASEYTAEATAWRILAAHLVPCRFRKYLDREIQEIRKFHEYHRWNTEWGQNTDSLLCSEILEVLCPLDDMTEEEEEGRFSEALIKVRGILDLWLRGKLPEGARVLPSPPFSNNWDFFRRSLEKEVKGLSTVVLTRCSGNLQEPGDDEWYESERSPPATDLDSLWEKVPDVSAVFFGWRKAAFAHPMRDRWPDPPENEILYTQEIERLRAKLEEAGIDPDV